MNEIEKITKRLRYAITESGYTYAQLEMKTGIPKSTLQRWAAGNIKKIPIDAIVIIANAVGISARWIMGWEGTSEPSDGKTLTDSQTQLLKLLQDLSEDDIDDLLSLAKIKAARHKSQDDS